MEPVRLEKYERKWEIPNEVEMLHLAADDHEGRIRAAAFEGKGVFSPSVAHISADPCPGETPRKRLAEIAKTVFALLSGDPEGRAREWRIRESLLDLVVLGGIVNKHFRADMLAREDLRPFYDEIQEAVKNARQLLVDEFGFHKEATDDPQSIPGGDTRA